MYRRSSSPSYTPAVGFFYDEGDLYAACVADNSDDPSKRTMVFIETIPLITAGDEDPRKRVLSIRCDPSKPIAVFYVDGIRVATITTNIPTEAGTSYVDPWVIKEKLFTIYGEDSLDAGNGNGLAFYFGEYKALVYN